MATASGTPFTAALLQHSGNIDLLPATCRSADDDIFVPSGDRINTFLHKDLSVKRLNNIKSLLWLAGRPMPPRHLGYQLVLGREIVVTEQIELHLVWHGRRLFIKPLPRYLLDSHFWTDHLSIPTSTNGPMSKPPAPKSQKMELRSQAKGFVATYCALVAYESDFRLANALGLLPAGISWNDWRAWTAQVLQSCPYATLAPRFWYGELRLSRLNKIYRFRRGALVRGYSRVGSPSMYGELLSDNFAGLAVGFGYFVIVLTAMQVGLATEHLQANATFQDVSWGFTVFSIISPLAAVLLIFGLFVVIFLANYSATVSYEKIRLEHMGVDPAGRKTLTTAA